MSSDWQHVGYVVEPEKIPPCPPGEHDLEWSELRIGWDPVSRYTWCTKCDLSTSIECLIEEPTA